MQQAQAVSLGLPVTSVVLGSDHGHFSTPQAEEVACLHPHPPSHLHQSHPGVYHPQQRVPGQLRIPSEPTSSATTEPWAGAQGDTPGAVLLDTSYGQGADRDKTP